MPSFGEATEWLNSEPLGPAELRGHVVLVNFWTLTCINWLRQEPCVRAWSQAYRNDGLVVIGVHTPEFSFEHELDRARLAVTERRIDYPVALDNNYEIWSAFDNHYWPALYFVDSAGVIRDHHFGEGRYEQSERVIQQLLGIEREPVPVKGLGVEASALVRSFRPRPARASTGSLSPPRRERARRSRCRPGGRDRRRQGRARRRGRLSDGPLCECAGGLARVAVLGARESAMPCAWMMANDVGPNWQRTH